MVFDRMGAYRAGDSECTDSFTEMCCNGGFYDFDFQVHKLTDANFELVLAHGNINLAAVR